MSTDLESAFAKRAITQELAFSMLTPNQKHLVEAHMVRYTKAIEVLVEKFGSPNLVPREAEDAMSNALYLEFPGEFDAMTAFALLEDKFLEAGQG